MFFTPSLKRPLNLPLVCIGNDHDEDDFWKVFDDLSSVETLSSFIHLLQLYKVREGCQKMSLGFQIKV